MSTIQRAHNFRKATNQKPIHFKLKDTNMQLTVTRQAKNASAKQVWDMLSKYSDMAWHPLIESSKDIGSIPDGSANMVGAVRVLVNTSGSALTETVTEWSDEKKYFQCSIDKGGPPFAKKFLIGFQVREDQSSKKVMVDAIVDMDLIFPLIPLTPLLKVVLSKKLGGLVDGIANVKP